MHMQVMQAWQSAAAGLGIDCTTQQSTHQHTSTSWQICRHLLWTWFKHGSPGCELSSALCSSAHWLASSPKLASFSGRLVPERPPCVESSPSDLLPDLAARGCAEEASAGCPSLLATSAATWLPRSRLPYLQHLGCYPAIVSLS